MNRISRFLSAVLIFLSLSSAAQEKQKMNISQLLDYSLENSYRVREARLNKLNSHAVKKEVVGEGLPQVSASVEYKDYLELPTMILPGALTGNPQASDIKAQFGKKYNLDAGVQVSQLLFSLQYIYGIKTANKANELSELGEEKTELDIIHQLYSEYFNLLAIYKNLEIIDSNIESLLQTRAMTKALVNADVTLSTDLDRIDVNLANLNASRRQVISGINIQTNNLKMIAGMDNNTDLVVDTTGFSLLFDSEILADRYSNQQVDLANRVELRLLDKKIELNNLQIKSEKAALTPNLAAYASYMYQAQREEFDLFDGDQDWFKVSLVGLQANIPIFSGGKSKAKISQVKIDRDMTVNQRNEAFEGLTVEYLNAMSNYQVSIDNCKTQLKNIELAEKVKNQEELKYNEGLSTLTDFLISESELRNAEINFVQNFIKMKTSELDLLKSSGKMMSLKYNN